MRDMKSELVFGKDSQDWFTSLVLVFICIGSEDQRWDCSISQISHVPIQLQPYVASITVGPGSYSLEELAAAFLSVTDFPLGYLVECKLREDKAVLGDACVLMSAFLSKLVTNILASNSGVTSPRQAPRHCLKYVFGMLAYCNDIALSHSESFQMIPQYWASNQGTKTLRTIEIKFECGCHRQHSKKKQRIQWHGCNMSFFNALFGVRRSATVQWLRILSLPAVVIRTCSGGGVKWSVSLALFEWLVHLPECVHSKFRPGTGMLRTLHKSRCLSARLQNSCLDTGHRPADGACLWCII